MATQNVTFTDPTVINQLQSLVGTSPAFNITQTQANIMTYLFGPTPYFGSAGSAPLPFMKVATGAASGSTTSQDAQGKTALSWAGVVGNAFTDQEYFFATGPVTANGDTITDKETVIMALASSAKFFNSFLWMKILDEKLISLSDPVSTYLPDWTGNYYYYIPGTCTGVYGTSSVAPNWSLFTGARGTGSLSEITVGQCISLNIGFPYWGSQYAPNGLLSAFQAPTDSTQPVEWSYLNSIKDGYFAMLRGIDYAKAGSGPAAALADPNAMWDNTVSKFSPYAPYSSGYDTRCFLTGSASDVLANSLKLIKNGTISLMYKVGDMLISPGSNIRQQRATYTGLSYSLLAACCSVAVRNAGYTSLFNYFNQKILAPLDITTSDLYIFGNQPLPSGRILADNVGRRYQNMSNTGVWIGYGADPALYASGQLYISSSGATGTAYNSLYFASQFPKDAQIGRNNFYNLDPLGWNFGSDIYCNFKAWTKIIKLFINKGRYNNKQIISRGMINWGMNNVSAAGAFFNQYNGYSQNGGPNDRWVAAQCYNVGTHDNTSDIQFISSSFPGARDLTLESCLSDKVFYWSGASGTQWCADIDTGFFACVYDAVSTLLNNAKTVSALNPMRYIQQSL